MRCGKLEYAELESCMWQDLLDPCQALYLRLYQRVGPWFRIASLEYSEVQDMAAAVARLAQAHFATALDARDADSLRSLAEARPLPGSDPMEVTRICAVYMGPLHCSLQPGCLGTCEHLLQTCR